MTDTQNPREYFWIITLAWNRTQLVTLAGGATVDIGERVEMTGSGVVEVNTPRQQAFNDVLAHARQVIGAPEQCAVTFWSLEPNQIP